MTPDSSKLPEADAAVLHGVIEQFEASIEEDLGKVGDPTERLRILSKLSEELGAVRNRLSGALRVSLGRIAFVMGLLVVGGAIGVGGTLALQDRDAVQNPGFSRDMPNSDSFTTTGASPEVRPGSPFGGDVVAAHQTDPDKEAVDRSSAFIAEAAEAAHQHLIDEYKLVISKLRDPNLPQGIREKLERKKAHFEGILKRSGIDPSEITAEDDNPAAPAKDEDASAPAKDEDASAPGFGKMPTLVDPSILSD